MAHQIIHHEFMQIPPVTRAYVATCVLTTIAIVSIFLLLNKFKGVYILEVSFSVPLDEISVQKL